MTTLMILSLGAALSFMLPPDRGGLVTQAIADKLKQTRKKNNLPIPDAPTLRFVAGPKPYVEVNWDTKIADKFNIYRSDSLNRRWKRIFINFPGNGRPAIDSDYPKRAKALYYRVSSVDRYGNEGRPSHTSTISPAPTSGSKAAKGGRTATPEGKAMTALITVTGRLVAGGAECQRFQAEDGKFYSLHRSPLLSRLKNGDLVRIEGTLVEVSYCMQDTPLEISKITRLPEK